MLLSQLPEDLLYYILSYLDYRSLSRLSQVCRSFHRFVNRDAVWKKIAKDFLNTGITREGKDIYPLVRLKERVKIAQHWYSGICKRIVPLKWKTKLLPWLQLDGDTLFLSQAADIKVYHIHKDSGRLQRSPYEVYSGHKSDVCRFVLTDSLLISGGSDGKIVVHNRRRDVPVEFSGHNQEVNCVDAKDALIISGSRDQTARGFRIQIQNDPLIAIFGVPVTALNISPQQTEILAFCSLLARRCILLLWKSPTPPSTSLWLNNVRTFVRVEKISVKVKGSSEKCTHKWTPFVEYLKSFPSQYLEQCNLPTL